MDKYAGCPQFFERLPRGRRIGLHSEGPQEVRTRAAWIHRTGARYRLPSKSDELTVSRNVPGNHLLPCCTEMLGLSHQLHLGNFLTLSF